MLSYLDNFISGLRKKSYSESNTGTDDGRNDSDSPSGHSSENQLSLSTEVEISSQSEDSCKTMCPTPTPAPTPNQTSYPSSRRKGTQSQKPSSKPSAESSNFVKPRQSSCAKRSPNDSKLVRRKSPGVDSRRNRAEATPASSSRNMTDKSLRDLSSSPRIFLDHHNSDTDDFDALNDCDQDDFFEGSRRSSSTSTGTGISNDDDTSGLGELELDPQTKYTNNACPKGQQRVSTQSANGTPIPTSKPRNRRLLEKQDSDSGDESDRFFDCEDGSEVVNGNTSHQRQRLLEHNSDYRESLSENETTTTSPVDSLKCKEATIVTSDSSRVASSCSKSKGLQRSEFSGGSQTSLTNPTAIEIHSSTFTVPVGGTSSSSSSSAFMTKTYSSSYKVLSFDQFHKLDQLMNTFIEIHGQGTFPNIKVSLKEFVVTLKSELRKENVPVESIRLNGGAASHVVGARQMIDDIGYNDLDLIFTLGSDQEMVFEKVRQRLYATLRSLLPQIGDSQIDQLSDTIIDDGYVQKMVKVSNNNDCWSLISLYNNDGENVEVKFVHRMKRQYEFSVDSFQIELDSLLSYYESNSDKSVTFTDDFFLTVMAESKYGKFDEALFHLNNKLVATLRPEEIRGGGLLKYCNLLLNGYHIADSDIKNMQRYMCSRFFIDFPDANSQQNKLQSYIRTHLKKAPKSLRGHLSKQSAAGSNNSQTGSSESTVTTASTSNEDNKENVNECTSNATTPTQQQTSQFVKEKEKVDDGSLECYRINFLKIVRNVIDYSTVCLMNIERACTLNLLDSMIYDLYRSFVLKREGKFPFEGNDSGYFGSENSSISNSLPSPSQFSRSSSPSNFSINGATTSTASRSSSPASAAFNLQTASRLQTPVDLAITPNGFLHSTTAMGIHFTTPQVFLPFTNLHNVSMMQTSGNVSASRNGGGNGHHGMGGFGGQQHHNQSQLHNHCAQNSLTSHNGGGTGGQFQQNSGSSSGHQNQHQTMSSHFQHHSHSHHSHHSNHGYRSGRNKGGMNNHQHGHYNHYNKNGGNSSNNSSGSNMHHHYHHGNNHQYHNYHINSNHFQSHMGSSHYYGGASSGGRGNNNYYHNQYNYHSHSPPYSAATASGGYQLLGYHSQQYQSHHPHNQLSHYQENEDPNVAANASSTSVGGGFSTTDPSVDKSCAVVDDTTNVEQLPDVDSFCQLADQCSASLDEDTLPDDEFPEVSASRSAETPPNFCQKGAAKYGPESTTPLALEAF